uniref:NADH-ubiquinone oxidoreductase chain 3 n=1 Tax=Chorotypus fenestratus TaxID=1564101 RepID=A0A0N6WAF1_9ORTH|nr:NADH dehydrogenase subunit 3 [Chorotypus fenestratus]
MFLMMMSITMTITILSIIKVTSTMLSKKSNDREKSSPFECGFEPKTSARMPFSLRFFLIAVIFLIFDVEIALIMPFIMTLNTSNMIMWTLSLSSFTIILIMGTYYEWSQGSLQWAE